MGGFTGAVLGFPTVLFGGGLVVVVGFWAVVLVGAADAHGRGHHGHAASHGHGHSGPHGHGHAAPHGPGHAAHPRPGRSAHPPLAALGLDGVPVTVVFSLLIAVGWFLSLAGSVALDEAGPRGGVARAAADCALLLAALTGAWSVTWVLVRPLRRLFPQERAPSLADFVGRICVIRTGTVTARFGQAEVAAPDGATAVVQVRQDGDDHRSDPLTAGRTALLYAYEPDGEFFWVAPFTPPAVT